MENSRTVEVKILNAFVDNNKGGNPAGVVLDADQYSNQEKQKIASLVGLSETAFVSKSTIADFKLDFFTPTRQIAHCGHATIATFSYLSQNGWIRHANSSKETIDGIRGIYIDNDLAFMEQTAPKYTVPKIHDKDMILKSLNITSTNSGNHTDITIVNTGNSFALIEIDSINVLKNIVTNDDLITQVSDTYDLIGYYVFVRKNDDDRDVTTRMFAPRYGIKEEAGTGMAAGPLACFLYDKLKINKARFLIEQGWYMQQPSQSLIIADLIFNNHKIEKLMVGGKGILADTKTVMI